MSDPTPDTPPPPAHTAGPGYLYVVTEDYHGLLTVKAIPILKETPMRYEIDRPQAFGCLKFVDKSDPRVCRDEAQAIDRYISGCHRNVESCEAQIATYRRRIEQAREIAACYQRGGENQPEPTRPADTPDPGAWAALLRVAKSHDGPPWSLTLMRDLFGRWHVAIQPADGTAIGRADDVDLNAAIRAAVAQAEGREGDGA